MAPTHVAERSVWPDAHLLGTPTLQALPGTMQPEDCACIFAGPDVHCWRDCVGAGRSPSYAAVIFPAGESRVDGTRRSLCHTRVHGPLHCCHPASPCRRRRGHRGREEVGTMQFGVMLPHRWLYAAGNTIADFAREAEALGYTSLWVTDDIIVLFYRTER